MTAEYHEDKQILIIRNELGKMIGGYIGTIVQTILNDNKFKIIKV